METLTRSSRNFRLVRRKSCIVLPGAPNKLIARRLDVAETTVKAPIGAILRKIGAANRTHRPPCGRRPTSPSPLAPPCEPEEPTEYVSSRCRWD